jgi:hypothetical protein
MSFEFQASRRSSAFGGADLCAGARGPDAPQPSRCRLWTSARFHFQFWGKFARPLLIGCLSCALPVMAGDSSKSRYVEPYPTAASKKGLQVEIVEDALALGVKHAALNLNLTALFSRAANDTALTFTNEVEMFQFQRAYLESMDAQIRPLSDRGVLVNLIVLTYASGRPEIDRVVLHPNYDPAAPNRLGAFNSVTPAGRRWLSACLSFLGERWSRPDQ